MDLVKIMAEGTMKAMALHANDRGIKVTEQMLAKARQLIKDGWDDFTDTASKAVDARMGESTYAHVLNVYCNSWAAKALKS